MRKLPLFTCFLLCFVSMILLTGCGAAPSTAELLIQCGADTGSLGNATVELRYLKQSKGANYQFVNVTSDKELLQKLVQAIKDCKPAQPPEAAQYSPELLADCVISVVDGSNVEHLFYFVAQGNLLIYPQLSKGKDRDTLCYQYYADDGSLAALIDGQRQNATLKQDNTVKPFRSLEELKASIDAYELAEAGNELSFEFYTDPTPPNTGTASCAYTFKGYAPLPNDSILITTFGKTKMGEQLKLSVVGMEANSSYTKIIVQEPDEALDSVDTGGGVSPESNAILFQKSAIDLKKWIVFVDEDGIILDVIIPEDIEGINEVINTPLKPAENPDEGSADDAAESVQPSAASST